MTGNRDTKRSDVQVPSVQEIEEGLGTGRTHEKPERPESVADGEATARETVVEFKVEEGAADFTRE